MGTSHLALTTPSLGSDDPGVSIRCEFWDINTGSEFFHSLEPETFLSWDFECSVATMSQISGLRLHQRSQDSWIGECCSPRMAV